MSTLVDALAALVEAAQAVAACGQRMVEIRLADICDVPLAAGRDAVVALAERLGVEARRRSVWYYDRWMLDTLWLEVAGVRLEASAVQREGTPDELAAAATRRRTP